MIKTEDFRTKSVYIKKDNPKIDGKIPIALDIGYSSVKGYSENNAFAFPSYARHIGRSLNLLGEPSKEEIIYRDDTTGELYRVGAEAQKELSNYDTNDAESEMFGRNWYFSKIFKIISDVGLGLALTGNPIPRSPIFIMTGLPTKYLEQDKSYLIEVLSGKHAFSLKIGASPFVKYDFTIYNGNIKVLSQPEGTLASITMDDNGNSVSNAKDYYNKNLVIYDGGFGTLNITGLKNRKLTHEETFSEYGMRAVLDNCSKKIKQQFGSVIRPIAMQNCLETGKIKVTKRTINGITSKSVEFGNLLENAAREVCDESINKILNIYDGLIEYGYLVVTGGTGASRFDRIKEKLSGNEDLVVIPGNITSPDMDIIFSNVRGYYMYLIAYLRRKG